MNSRTHTRQEAQSAPNKGDDPRIVSPDIKVVYPIEDQVQPETKPPVSDSQPVIGKDEIVTPEPKETHVCSITFQEAIKQHLLSAIGAALLLVLVGYLIGKK